ncbi:MAG: mechanosensitive ion channel protein MscS [Pelagibacteraceae bacterium]|nr:mechanosensitive ion channel protein MscS [Pelagibacteraceae bacterium]|tara:strand:+ start:82 stop:984 length:903 start_codon:yes stop_codon:yes gene_type:complete
MDLNFLNIFKDSYQTFVNIFIIIFIGFFGWKTLSTLIKKKLNNLEGSKDEAQTQRINTLFRILKNFVSIAILIVVIMLVLSELGIEIGPLIAAAGVVGLAFGFGAQTLVKDIITGLFIILEGQITIGDIVEVAGHSGRVEAITIRTVRLRDVNGHLHVVPFSEVTTVKNITQDQDYHSFEIGVSYNEDVDHVMETIEKVGKDLEQDKEFKSKINGKIEVFGLDKFEDSAIVIKGRIPTVHKQQWIVKREFNRRIKLAFDKSGIEIPFPQRTISYPDNKKKTIKKKTRKRRQGFTVGTDDS